MCVLQAENATQKQVDLIKINDNTKRNLEQEIQGYKMEAQRQSKLIYQLEKEREKYAIEASEAAAKYMQVRAEQLGFCFIVSFCLVGLHPY
jgi:hypothetical protein